jgi:hypothetical protein
MRGGATLKNIFNYTHPTNAVKADTIDKLAKKLPDATSGTYDKLYINIPGFRNDSKETALRIAIRKAIITKFPQYVTEDGVINYLEIVNEYETGGVIPIPEFKNYRINIAAQMRRIILIVPGYFSDSYYTIYEPAHNGRF